MFRPLRLAALAAVALVLLGGLPAWAGPSDRLREFFDAVNRILADPETADRPLERVRRVRPLVRELADVYEAAATALDREWPARSPAEREEFVALFAELLERGYIGRLAGRGRVADGVRVVYLNELVAGEEATVQTALGAREGGEAIVEYRMVRRDDQWRVRDLVLDGVSTVENYRAQFRRLLRQGTYRELVAQVRAKLEDESIIFTPLDARAVPAAGPPPPAVVQLVPVEPGSPAAERAPELRPARAAVVAAREERPALRSRDVGWRMDAVTGRAGVSGPPPPPALRYWVQVAAFKSSVPAARLAERLHGVVVTSAENGRLVRVRVGPFAERDQARAKLLELETLGYRPFIAAAR